MLEGPGLQTARFTGEVYPGDLDFFLEHLGKLTDCLHHERPSDFAERVRYLTADLTPFPGPFSFDRFPYFRKILDCFDPSDPTEEVVVMKGNQMGFTTAVLENLILYLIMCDPKAQMYVTADAGLAKTSVQTRIEKMIDRAGARHLIFSQSQKKRGARNTGDTVLAKEYPGGYLHTFGGKSPARFRGLSYPRALTDEVDSFPDSIPKEGTVIDLVRNRTNAYAGNKRKILFGSTPLEEHTSKIKKLYLSGDQEKFFVPCKHCGTMQELVWHGKDPETGYTWGIVWENDDRFQPITEDPERGIQTTVAYKCCNPACAGLMKNYDKSIIIPLGEWRATAKPLNYAIKSFHITPLYNPPGMYSWDDMVKQWAECWDIEHNRLRDKEKYRLFRNTKQGLTFEDFGVHIKSERAIQFRRTGFIVHRDPACMDIARGVPNGLAVRDAGSPILIVVASVDVQKKCLYVDVKGYGAGGVTWTLEFRSIEGDTEQFNGPWDELDRIISDSRYVGTDGKVYRISITLVDSGHFTEWVYAYVKRHSAGVYACKGKDWIATGETYQSFSRSALDQTGMGQAYWINAGKLKDKISASLTVLSWLSGQPQPPWYPNFPEDFRDDYFRMFEAETKKELIDKASGKVYKMIWSQSPGQENHAFDTYVYNLAALEILAEDICKQYLGLPALDWTAFWDLARQGIFCEK